MRIPNFLEKGWGRVKKLWDRLPKLPRRWRIVRNLTLAAALAVLVLELLEWPSLSSYRAFQRLEGAFLLTPSRLVFQVERGKTAGYLSEGDSWIAVGSVSKFDDAGKPLNLYRNYALLHYILPKEGIVAVLLPAKNEHNGAVVAVWGAPEQAVSGTMELDLKGVKNPFQGTFTMRSQETLSAQARRREDGWFIFQFVPHDDHGENIRCTMDMLMWWGPAFSWDEMEQPYRLTLTDGQGNTVAEQSATLSPAQRLPQWP